MKTWIGNVICGVIATALASAVYFLWDSSFSALWQASPQSFMGLCFVAAGLGVCLGIAIGRAVRLGEMERQGMTPEAFTTLQTENKSMSEKLAAICDIETKRFMEQLPFVKVMALEAYDRGGISDPHEFLLDYITAEEIYGLVDDLFIQESLVPEGTRWVLKPEVRQMLDRSPDLLAQTRSAKEAGDVGEWKCYTVHDDCVARDEKKFLESQGLEFMTWEPAGQ